MSFTAAAQDLFMTQPAVSVQIRALEQSLGLKLFERSGSGLRLTEAGEALRETSGLILSAADAAERAMAELRGATRGRLLIGANTTGGMYAVPPLIREFLSGHPDAELMLQIDSTERLLERLQQSMLDLAFVGGPVEDEHLVAEPLCADRLVLIASPGHPLATQQRVALADLVDLAFVFPEPGSRTRQLVERRLRERGVVVRPYLQLTGTEAVKKAVEAGLGLAFVSGFAVLGELAIQTLRAISVVDFEVVRQLEMVHRRGKYFTPLAGHFQDFARAFEGWPGLCKEDGDD